MALLADYDDFDDLDPTWAALNGLEETFPASAFDIALAAMTVGRPRSAPTSIRRLLQMASVAVDVLANLDSGPPRPFGVAPLECTPEYWDLDSTERAAATYRIGMGVAKYVAEERFNVEEMVHLTLLASTPAAPVIAGAGGSRRRADLAAGDVAGNWLFVEAKGRGTASDVPKALSEAKQQAEDVRLYGPGAVEIPLLLRLATVVDLSTSPLTVSVRDPEESEMPKHRYEIRPEAVRDVFYAPARDLREATSERPGSAFEVEDITAVDLGGGVAVGADHELLERALDPKQRGNHRTDRPRRAVESGNFVGRVGPDGYALLVDRFRYSD